MYSNIVWALVALTHGAIWGAIFRFLLPPNFSKYWLVAAVGVLIATFVAMGVSGINKPPKTKDGHKP